MRLYVASLIAVAALGCSKPKPAATTPPPAPAEPAVTDAGTDPATPPPAATPSDAELEAMFEQTLVFIEDLGTAVDANQANCGAMATAITAAIDKHQPLLAKAKLLEGNQEVDAKADAYMDARKDRVGAAMAKVQPGMEKCSGDPAVQAAMAKFDNM
ncbi:MAG: hypothetical protein IPH44_25265 [Myxococcales bacterium]|jgi:hypothetical protein|nr:hypothetical protein [Myxococcales bacterium]MBK7191711.1 hypothetical protein [Myxococcales bacterium]MBP6843103.1 hypothetical protein [Kofleriaceae bacterium]